MACFIISVYQCVFLKGNNKMSFAPTTRVGYEGGLAHDREVMTRMREASGAADGGGLTPRMEIPKDALLADSVELGGKQKNGASKKGMLTTTVLLAGGALIGYLCRGPISSGINAVKDAASKFFASGKPAELLASGKGLLEKAKGAIFAK